MEEETEQPTEEETTESFEGMKEIIEVCLVNGSIIKLGSTSENMGQLHSRFQMILKEINELKNGKPKPSYTS